MNTTMPQDSHFNKQYRQHLQCLKLGGLQPKTIDAYARAIRRIGNYFDCRIDNLSSGQLLRLFHGTSGYRIPGARSSSTSTA